jgi:RNA polymerase sigma-70 factor (ECF subfamily)
VSRRVERLRDEVLILEYRAGDLAALETLVSRWQARLYWYVLAVVWQDADAWDVSQQVWVAVMASLRKGRHIRSFAAWLYGVAHNKAVSHLRKAGRLNPDSEELEQAADVTAAGPLDRAAADDDARLVHECLGLLPLAQREALSLFYLDDLSLEEIADVLGMPRGTVQSRLHYGRERLRKLLLMKGYSRDER